jgi:predicted HTH transcriptional regulator
VISRSPEFLSGLVQELRNLDSETEWVEFKQDNADPKMIGERISALSNSAALVGKVNAYMVWGIHDRTHEIIGTDFHPSTNKVGNEQLENWLLQLLSPKINFRFYVVRIDVRTLVILEIAAANRTPVQFQGTEYIRIGSYQKKLKDYPEKERELWRIFDTTPFEREIAAENISSEEVTQLLDFPSFFDLLNLPLPESRSVILESLESEDLIRKTEANRWNITNLGAVLFAKRLDDFHKLRRKAMRVILYRGDSRIETIREQPGTKGYASSFEGLVGFVLGLLPENEVMGQALRTKLPMFPELAVRELIANALIHQDFHITGTGPMVEIFKNRLEITNPGLPLVKTDRFLDSPPQSRNEALASFMRRIGVCEERGSGIDKVVNESEVYQLPAPLIETTEHHTRVVLFAHRAFSEMDKSDRTRACYLHACLRYVQRDFMTNSTLRERFKIKESNSSMVSRIIKDTLNAGLIRHFDDSVGTRAMKYVPAWAS